MPGAAAGPLLILLLVWACSSSDGPSAPEDGAVFLLRVCRGSEHAPEGELFRALVYDPGVIFEAQDRIGDEAVVGGPLVAGDGGFNAPWSWHLDPHGVSVAEGSIEVCQGCPSFVEADLDYWLGNLGMYCPIVEILGREH